MNSLVQKMIRVGNLTPMVIYPTQYDRLAEVAGALEEVSKGGEGEVPYSSLHAILKTRLFDVLEEIDNQGFEEEKATTESVIAARKLEESEE